LDIVQVIAQDVERRTDMRDACRVYKKLKYSKAVEEWNNDAPSP
jgi:hypothetical protein